MIRQGGAACALALALGLAPPAAAQIASPQTPENGMAGIKVAVTDFERSVEFYRLLGLELDRKPNDHEWSLKWPGKPGGPFIYIVRGAGGTRRVVPGGGFVVISVSDMRAAIGRLKAAGHPNVGEPRVMARASLLFISDPDGNTVELIGPGEG